MNTHKHLREVVDNFEKWSDVSTRYEKQARWETPCAAEYHRGAKEAFERCLDRIRQLFAEELKK